MDELTKLIVRKGKRMAVAKMEKERDEVPVVNVAAIIRELGLVSGADIDIGSLSEEALAAVELLHDVCRGGSGGLIAVGHGFGDQIQAALDASHAFHASSKEMKEAHIEARLYDKPGAVKIAVRPSSLHERFSYPRTIYPNEKIESQEIQKTAPLPVEESAEPLFQIPGIDTAMRNYQQCIRTLTLALLRAIAIKLELSPTHFDDGWLKSNSGITSLYYLPLNENVPTTDGYYGQEEGYLPPPSLYGAGADSQGM